MGRIFKIKSVRLILLICLILVLPWRAFGDDIDVKVSHSDDDAEQELSTGNMHRSSSDLEMAWDDYNNRNEQAIGIRFKGISIPPGAVVTNAFITFTAKDDEENKTDLLIKGEASDNAVRFTNTKNDITDRIHTNASVAWNNLPPWSDNVSYDTPNLRSLVQEIVNRDGWSAGNSMVFLIGGSGNRRAYSYNGSTSSAPLLHIEYSKIKSPYIQVDKTKLKPVCFVGNNPETGIFTITNDGTAQLNYGLAVDQSWVNFSTNAGILPPGTTASISVDYSALSMDLGFYTAIITIQDKGTSPLAPNSPVKINITLKIIPPTVEVSVASSNDDAEESETGSVNTNSPDLELVEASTNQMVGLRFQNIIIPKGAMITKAYIQFDVDEDANINPVELFIYGENSNNPGTFTTAKNNISSRNKTDQFIEWNNFPNWNLGEQHRTPDLSSIVQAIIGKTGWSKGNSMTFIVEGSGKRVAESYDGNGAPPLLHIEFLEGSFPYITVSSNNIGAMCYQKNNAVDDSITMTNTGDKVLIYELELETADGGNWISISGQNSTGTLNPGESANHKITYESLTLAPGNYDATIKISGVDTPNSPYEVDVTLTVLTLPEGTNCGNVPIYTENLTSPAIMVLLDVSSSMKKMMNVGSAVKPRTPDLSSIVQETVNRDDWEYKNSMAFIITGTGHRTASSFEGSSGGAPLLHVEYNDGIDREIDIRVSQGTDDAEEKKSSGKVNAKGSSDLELVTDGSNRQIVGIRFQNVAIPKNANIKNAYLEFEIDEAQSELTSLTIHGQAHDNPVEFTESDNNISSRSKTSSSVDWKNIEPWEAGAQMSRIEIGKDVTSNLVKDRSISWGFGTWCSRAEDGYISDIDYTKIHVGCKFNDETQQAALQKAISETNYHYGTPFDHSIKAAKEYFIGNKNDRDGAGEPYSVIDCQPLFLINITDGLGNGTVAKVAKETHALCDANVTPIAVGFGVDNAAQIKEMAKVSNERGDASPDLHSLHEEIDGVGQPFFANDRELLVNTLSTITENIKAVVFHGSASAPTTSVDHGNVVIVAKFNATDWSGDLEARTLDPDTEDWTKVLWKASEELPFFARNILTVNPNGTGVIEYSFLNLANDNYFDPSSAEFFCKPFGDFINSIPVIVGDPPFYYPFDGYGLFKPEREPMVYIGANDGALHAFSLDTGEEKWAFVPLNLHAKLNRANEPEFNMCGNGYCHQYFVDGSPQVGDIYDGSSWKTILVCGEGEGGDAYFALDVTTGTFNSTDSPGPYLWEFRDTNATYLGDEIDNDLNGKIDEPGEDESDNQQGQTGANVSIERVADDSTEDGDKGTVWGVFFGSGYSSTNQENKQAYLYGIKANDKTPLWQKDDVSINRIKLSDSALVNDAASPLLVADFEGDYISDSIYVGNLYGTMYRVSDIGKGLKKSPSITNLFDFYPSNLHSGINPITAKASYAYGARTATENYPIWIYFGTGDYKSQVDKTTMNQQLFFGLRDSIDAPSCYLYPFPEDNIPNPTDPDVCGDLVELKAKYMTGSVTTAEGVTEKKKVRYIEGPCIENKSWVINLYNGQLDYKGPINLLGSERVIEEPLVAGGIVFFATYIPDPDICNGSGKTWLYAVDYKTGCAPADVVFDLNGDGAFNERDTIPNPDDLGNPYVPVAILIDGGPGSKPVLGSDNNLFITTPAGGLNSVKVNIPGLKVKMNSWRENTK